MEAAAAEDQGAGTGVLKRTQEEHPESPKTDDLCKRVPAMVSMFVDAFVDFAVGGQVLGPETNNASSVQDDQDGARKGDAGTEVRKPAAPGDAGMVTRLVPGMVTRLPAVERLVAIGDVHGDLGKTKEAMKIAGVADDDGKWVGGNTTVVQVGDLLDRGGEELKVIYFLEKLKKQAQVSGGDVVIMNGNHEIMNADGDFRYATKEGLEEFAHWGRWFRMGQALKERCTGLGEQPDVFRGVRPNLPEGVRARYAALRPGGPITSRFLSHHPTIVIVGSTVFAHGGILPQHIRYGLNNINEDVKKWMQDGTQRRAPRHSRTADAVVWCRRYSHINERVCDCSLLKDALRSIGSVERMVVGHTIQAPWGINAACDNQVVRVDVGMSKGCNNTPPEVLEIRGDKEVRVLTANAKPKKLEETAVWMPPPGLGSLLI